MLANILSGLFKPSEDQVKRVVKDLATRQEEFRAMMANQRGANAGLIASGKAAFEADRENVIGKLVATLGQHRDKGDWHDVAQFSDKWVALGYREALAAELDALGFGLPPGWMERSLPAFATPYVGQLVNFKGWKAVVAGESITKVIAEVIGGVLGFAVNAALVAGIIAFFPWILAFVPELILLPFAASGSKDGNKPQHHVWLWMDANLTT